MSLRDLVTSRNLFLAGLSLGILAGLSFGWWRWRPEPGQYHPVKPQPGYENQDGSTVLPVQPAGNLDQHSQALHVPAGSHVETSVSVTVQPSSGTASPGTPGAPQDHSNLSGLPSHPEPIPCPPVTVDITVYRDPDGSRRVVVSSPDGKVLKGIQLENEVGPPRPKVLLNSAGLVYGTTAWGDKALGAYYDRDWKFLRFGGELTKNTYALAGRQGWEVRAKIGLVF